MARNEVARTIAYYEGRAQEFWEGTKDHDVAQNYEALLSAIEGDKPFRILDLGCGPGRDVAWFKSQGHEPVGLDATPKFVEMARAHSGCEIWEQDFLALDLPKERFDGIFANASLFHVPTNDLGRVLGQLRQSLVTRGVLFASNPRGDDTEGVNRERFGAYWKWETWEKIVRGSGFDEIRHYYRPEGLPREQQPWLASVWRKKSRKV